MHPSPAELRILLLPDQATPLSDHASTRARVIKRRGVIRIICKDPKHKQRQG